MQRLTHQIRLTRKARAWGPGRGALIKHGHQGKPGGHVTDTARPRQRSPPCLGSRGLSSARAPPPAELEHLLRGVEPQLLDFS